MERIAPRPACAAGSIRTRPGHPSEPGNGISNRSGQKKKKKTGPGHLENAPGPFCSRHLPGPGSHPSHAQNLLRHLSVHTGPPCSELSSRKAETACSSVSSTLSPHFLGISDGAEPKADAQKCLLEWRK
ncbi:unnamed protein product [Rangifer tarandus platyrhynchus]|uniref:Uncharacterized protein n=1 Tax=Rangifer tarandus platyrhynchus TaxID=3082113 RepID=A0AC60A4E7_RANTA